ncbi:dihydropyrimidinase [Candidatus Bipolaricaulota bacterium]|nr:dihydropyrimidinase [Candidatus Bipolaricaulota bacterium]
MFELVIKNGTIVNPAGRFQGDIGINDRAIESVSRNLKGENEIDASGCFVVPGGVDPHTHLEMQSGELVTSDTFHTGTIAAAHGGTTTIIDFVEPEEGVSLEEAFKRRRKAANDKAQLDYSFHMTIPSWHASRGINQREIIDLMDSGITSFKLYQAYEGLRLEDDQLYQTLKTLGSLKALPIIHSENGPLSKALQAEKLEEGKIEPRFHAASKPPLQEAEAVSRAIEIANLADSPLYVVHVSAKESVHKIQEARGRGESIYGETCPQYLLLDKKLLEQPAGEKYVCSPPLREAEDQKALWKSLNTGALQVVATDHAPFTEAEKLSGDDFTQVPGGLPSIEGRLSFIYNAGVKSGKISLEKWVNVTSTRPARIFGLEKKGLLEPGYDADIVVFDPKVNRVISPENLHENVDWSPYEGFHVEGWPRTVISKGEVLVSEGEYLGQTGSGEFVQRKASSIY